MLKPPLRVLITTPNLDTAGMRLVVRDLIYGFDRTAVRPSLCVHTRTGVPLERELEQLVDCFRQMTLRHALRPLRTLVHRLSRDAESLRGHFDIIHSFDYASTWPESMIARIAGIPFILEKLNMTWGTRRWWLHGLLSHRIICLSETQRREIFAGTVLSSRARVIHTGVDLSTYAPATEMRDPLRRELGLASDSLAVACVANLVPGKGHADLIDAFARVVPLQPSAVLVLIGSGDDRFVATLRSQIAAKNLTDRVLLFGRRHDVARILPAFDGFALASHKESFGAVLIEAMACGLPVIATRCGGPEDIVVPGETGWLQDVGDIDGLTRAIVELVTDSERRVAYGVQGRRCAEQYFSRDTMVRRYEQIYREVA